MMDDTFDYIFFSTVVIIFLTIGGFGLGMGMENQEDDKDCQGAVNPHDESEREVNNCKKYCVKEPLWFFWGTHEDCYWDDE